MTCSCSRSPPFRSVRELRILIWHPPLYPYHNIDHHPGEKVLRPALHHLGWPWLRTPPYDYPCDARCFRNPAHHHLGWPWSENTLFLSHLCFLLLPIFSSCLAAPPAESKVIQIQSDHLLAASPPVAAMERSKVTCPIQVC